MQWIVGCSSMDSSPRDGGDASVPPAVDANTALDPAFFDPCASNHAGDPIFHWANPDPATININALQQLLSDAASQKSDAVIVAVGDTVIADKCFSSVKEPATIQSITKSIVSLAVGVLIANGEIASLDTPISRFFPEWTDGTRAMVTLRHLLTQTSGLVDEVTDAGANGLFSAPDALAYARSLHPSNVPGTTFNYSNVGVMLLGGIVTRAAGKDAAAFIQDQLFTPLGITDAKWSRDQAGNAMTPGGLFLTPLDLLRIARLARQQGMWQGNMLVPMSWIALSTAPQTVVDYPCYGYLWWMIRDNCNADTGLTGTAGPLQGFDADGYGGNYAAVIPSSNVIGVRTKLQTSNDQTVVRQADFDNFPRELGGLVK
jgi:CubicO group peptidase (beta-lactamase class C family)